MKKIKLSKFEWVKKNIVIVPVVAAILAGTGSLEDSTGSLWP